ATPPPKRPATPSGREGARPLLDRYPSPASSFAATFLHCRVLPSQRAYFGIPARQTCLFPFISPAHQFLGPSQLAVVELHLDEALVFQVGHIAAHGLIGEARHLGQLLLG